MSSPPEPRLPRYLVEWYHTGITGELLDETAEALEAGAAAASARGRPVRLVTVIAAPEDEVLFAVLAAGSSRLVAEVCHAAGLSPGRITSAVTTDPRRPIASP